MTAKNPRPAATVPRLGRLLVVDDEVELMEALCEMLRDKGYEVDGFTSGTKGLAALHGADYDILLADLMMPELNGVELLKAGLQIDSHLVGIIMTGQGTVQTAVEAMKAGAFDYILKPFKLETVLPVIARAMGVRRLRRENVQLRATLAIYELNQAIAYTLDPDTLLNKVADAVLEQCQADEVSILLPAREGAELRVAVVRGEGREKLLGTRMASDRGVAGWVAQHREPLTLHGEARDPRFAPVQPRADIHSAISMPMLAGNKLVGVLNVNATQRRSPFTLGEVKALGILVSTASAALEAASLYTQVRTNEEKYRVVLDNVNEIVYRVDINGPDPAQGKVEFVSPRVENIIGFTPEEFVSDPGLWVRLLHPEDAPAMIAQTRIMYETGHGGTREYRLRHKTSGEYHWMEDRISLQSDAEGRPVTLVGVARDITERKRAEERIEHLAHHDALTGLPNRVLFADRLNQAMLDAERRGRQAGVLFLDLDRFKNINDSLGHEIGDQFLRAVTERFAGAVRKGDTVARLGGDEFAVVLADMARGDDAARVAQKLLDVFARPFHFAGRELFMTTSAGITLFPVDGRDAQTLLRNADVAMYRAKDAGRNTYRFYAAEMSARAQETLAIESDLRGAIEHGELFLEYQPVVDIARGNIVGCEALARWRHPVRGLVPPSDFVPIAEESGLILALSDWVLRTASAQNARWQAAGLPPLRVAVNLSAQQFAYADLVTRTAQTLADAGLEARYLAVEITESVLMQNPESAAGMLHDLKHLGAQISLDDFGTGYSSLSYLKRFPIDTLKIDRSFVRDIPADPDDTAIAEAIIRLAHTLGIRVVAEGVETTQQLDFMRQHGCDMMQGYLFSRPLAPEAFEQLMRGGKPAVLS